MTTSEERLKILKMIRDGKITAEEGIQLMEALELNSRRVTARPNPVSVTAAQGPQTGQSPRWLRVRVTDIQTGKVRVNVRLPVGVVTAGMKMGARFSPEVEGLDMNRVLEFIRAGEMGKIVDVYDDEDGEHVEVFIE